VKQAGQLREVLQQGTQEATPRVSYTMRGPLATRVIIAACQHLLHRVPSATNNCQMLGLITPVNDTRVGNALENAQEGPMVRYRAPPHQEG
jgi:hypothetical protein